MRWCQTDLAATAYRWRKLVGRADAAAGESVGAAGGRGEGLLFGDLDQGISHDGLMAQEVVKRGWKVRRGVLAPVGRLLVGLLVGLTSHRATCSAAVTQSTSASLATNYIEPTAIQPTTDPGRARGRRLPGGARPQPPGVRLEGAGVGRPARGVELGDGRWAGAGGCVFLCDRCWVCMCHRAT